MPDDGPGPALTDPLPTLDASMGATIGRFRRWFEGVGRFAGWFTIPIFFLFIMATVFVSEAMAGPCYLGTNPDARGFYDRYVYDSGCLEVASYTMGAVSLFLVVAFAFSIATLVAILTQGKAVADPATGAYRLQGIKDWFIRGEIDESDYQNLRKLIESTQLPSSPVKVARSATVLLRTFAILLAPLGIFWTIFISIFIEELAFGFWEDGFAYLVNYIGGALLGTSLFVLSLVRTGQLRRFQEQYGKDLAARIDGLEQDVMRRARGRSGPRAALPYAGPEGAGSFTPYARRR